MKITYYVQRYRPAYEAISKEIELLAAHFSQRCQVKIHDLHLDGLFSLTFTSTQSSYHFAYYPLLAPYAYLLSRRSQINHIYTSLGDLPYLKVLDLQNTILTAAASCHQEKIKRRVAQLRRLKKIIVETEQQYRQLVSLGFPPQQIELIYPPVDTNKFTYRPAAAGFTVLNASCPTRTEDFAKRGIGLLLDTAEQNIKVQFLLAWRPGAFQEIQDLIERRKLSNVLARNEILTEMNDTYAQVHCTIIPYTDYDDFLKLIPASAVESLAAGKPVLVSSKTGLAPIIEREQCGLVFEPTVGSLQQALQKIQKNYHHYQSHCQETAKKYFSREIFLQKYEKIYAEIYRQERIRQEPPAE